MKNCSIFCFPFILLAGCNSPEKVGAQSPDETIFSSREKPEIVNCLSDKFGMDGRTEFNSDGSVTVSIAGELNVIASFTVVDAGESRRVEVRKTDWPIVFNYKACIT